MNKTTDNDNKGMGADISSNTSALVKALQESLLQVQELLNTVNTQNQTVYQQSGMGVHIRHIIDHILTLKQGLNADFIDYNKRNRESEIERNLTLAQTTIDDLIQWIQTSPLLSANKTLTIRSEISCRETISANIASTLERELHYITFHSIHHLAYCALLAKMEGLNIDSNIGIAPGTASHLRAVNA